VLVETRESHGWVAELALATCSNSEITAAIGKVMPTVEQKRKRRCRIWGGVGYG
jgi:hypothetical protein